MKHETNVKPSFNWVKPSRGGGGYGGNAEGARIAIYAAGKHRPQLSIALYGDTMKSMRWVIGDRVEVGFGVASKCIAIRRVPSGGFALTALFTPKDRRENAMGKSLSAVVKLTAPNELLRAFHGKTNVPPEGLAEVDGILVLPFHYDDGE
jgi:hypothetical protein